MIGKTVLHYKILEKLGEGGMGVVYLAEDTKLKRQVAIKFLPHNISANSEEKTRFEIEAQAAAALNHPNIATIHAIENDGDEIFIVMEYVEGQELKSLVGAGSKPALTLDQIVNYAIQIASGLQAAHDKGIVHRDIKSSNIMMTDDGQVKIMDFGLAKIRGGVELTKEQSTLGTAAYMSPEQTRGEEVDYRTDIWSFGVVLYEMLSGQLPFQAAHQAAMIYEVINGNPPPLKEVKETVDPDLSQIVMKCLEKELNRRYQSISEIASDIEWYLSKSKNKIGGKSIEKISTKRSISSNKTIIFVAGVVLLIFVVYLSYLVFKSGEDKKVADKIITRLTSAPGLEDEPAWSLDGKMIAFTSDDRGNLDIMILPAGGGNPVRLVDSDADDAQPAWSPDGSKIAFVSARDYEGHLSVALGIGSLQNFITGKGGDIYIIPASGGSAVKLVENGYYPAWSPDGKYIVYQSPRSGAWNIWIVPVEGGSSKQLTLDETFDYHPSWSPDGKWIVYCSGKNPIFNLRVISVSGGRPVYLTDENQMVINPTWTPNGENIIFSSNRSGSINLWKIPFSELPENDLEIARQITIGQGDDQAITVSQKGKRLAYSTVRINQDIWELNYATGDTRQITSETSEEDLPQLASDGRTLLLVSDRGNSQGLWTLDLSLQKLQPVVNTESQETMGVWSPDEKRIVYRRGEAGEFQLIIHTLDSGEEEIITAEVGDLENPDWSPDGSKIVYSKQTNQKYNIWIYDITSNQHTQITNMEMTTTCPTWSPDGEYLTFQAQKGSIRHIWIIPSGGGKASQLTHGEEEHSHPQWSPTDPDLILFVLNHKNLCTVSVSTAEIKQITNYKASDSVLDYPSWSPDGKAIYYSISRKIGDLYLLENY